MEQLLNGLPCVIVRIDDILFWGDTPVETLEILENVLNKLSDSGVMLKKNTCEFLSGNVVFCGTKLMTKRSIEWNPKLKPYRKHLALITPLSYGPTWDC